MATFRAGVLVLIALTFVAQSQVEGHPLKHLQKNTEMLFTNILDGLNQFLQGLGNIQSPAKNRGGRRTSSRPSEGLTDEDLAWLEMGDDQNSGFNNAGNDDRNNNINSNRFEKTPLTADDEAWLNFEDDYITDANDEAFLNGNSAGHRGSSNQDSFIPPVGPKKSVNVEFPFGSVNVDEKGVDVRTPFVSVSADDQKRLDVTAPFARVNVDKGNVDVSAPFTDVNVNKNGGVGNPFVNVNVDKENVGVGAPFTSVNVDGKNVAVRAPFTNVDVNEDYVSVRAPFTSINIPKRRQEESYNFADREDTIHINEDQKRNQGNDIPIGAPLINVGVNPEKTVRVSAPLTDVRVSPEDSTVDIIAPLTRVNVDEERIDVSAPFTNVNIEKWMPGDRFRGDSNRRKGVTVNAPFTNVRVGPNKEVNVRAPFTFVDVVPHRSVRVRAPFVDFGFGEGGMTLNIGR